MNRFLSSDVLTSLAFATYRYRFLAVYVAIGVLALSLEVMVYGALRRAGIAEPLAVSAGVASSIVLAYWGNARFNFRVPVARRRKAFGYFVAISLLSIGVQFLVSRPLKDGGLSYEQARFLISGLAFGLAYLLHRRYSFADFKKVGVAVYANGIEDIKSIHARIGDFADIIHVDIVDATYGREDNDVRTYRLEAVRAYWQRKAIHVHIMSRKPSHYLPELLPYADRIYVHLEIDEELEPVLHSIREAGKEPGLAVCLDTPLAAMRPHLASVRGVLFLAIPKAGSSGQPFQMKAIERIAEFNHWPERAHVDVCVDGGVGAGNVGLLNAEIVISGSSVLRSADPRKEIMRLQTSSSYERF